MDLSNPMDFSTNLQPSSFVAPNVESGSGVGLNVFSTPILKIKRGTLRRRVGEPTPQ